MQDEIAARQAWLLNEHLPRGAKVRLADVKDLFLQMKGPRMTCLVCEDEGWVCENHPDQPFTGPHACSCGGAGMHCPKCNPSTVEEPPRLPKGFEPGVD